MKEGNGGEPAEPGLAEKQQFKLHGPQSTAQI